MDFIKKVDESIFGEWKDRVLEEVKKVRINLCIICYYDIDKRWKLKQR